MKKRIKVSAVLLAVMLVLMVFVPACSSKSGKSANDSDQTGQSTTTGGNSGKKEGSGPEALSFPISQEKMTLTFSTVSYKDVAPAYNDKWVYKEYEKMTNISMMFDEIPASSIQEKKNIMMATNSYSDGFYKINFSNTELMNYGSQGLFIPLEGLIEKYAPNFSKLLKEMPDIKKAITMPDGHIYALPFLNLSQAATSIRYYFNKKWLDKLGLKMPATLDEYYNVMKEFKTKDPNNNGQADEWGVENFDIMRMEAQLMGSYGLGNRGRFASQIMWIDMGEGGNLRFLPKEQRFKEMWQWLAKIYKDGLINPDTISGIPMPQFQADSHKDIVGSFSHLSAGVIGMDLRDNYFGTNVLKGPYGDAMLTWIEPGVKNPCVFIITKKNKNPVESIKWVDYFYSEEGYKFLQLGKEGVTYTMKDGEHVYLDDILKYKGGPQLGAFQYLDNIYGGQCPTIMLPDKYRYSAMGMSQLDEFRITEEDLNNIPKLAPKEVWSVFIPSKEEADETNTILADLNTYLTEMRAQFISGKKSFDEWDDFIAQLDRIGAKRYMIIREAQYKRYMEVK